MPNRAIEFHDSTLHSLQEDGMNLRLRFSAAYIHESSGEPGWNAGSGWVQEAVLHITDVSLSGEVPELPCDLWDGDLRLGNDLFKMIPIPLNYHGAVEINLERDRKMRVIGTHVRLELVGEATYVEEFPGHS